MRRVREFTAFEALVHTVVKRLGFSLRGIADHLGMCGGAISGAFASGVKASRTGPTYIVHRMKLLNVFQAAPRKAPPELFSRFGERGHKKRFKPSEQPKEETIIERRHGNG